MTLAEACLMLPELGIEDLQIHRDHLCHAEHSHEYGACPMLCAITFSAADLAPLATRDDLRRLLIARFEADADDPACIACAPVVPDCALSHRWPWSREGRP